MSPTMEGSEFSFSMPAGWGGSSPSSKRGFQTFATDQGFEPSQQDCDGLHRILQHSSTDQSNDISQRRAALEISSTLKLSVDRTLELVKYALQAVQAASVAAAVPVAASKRRIISYLENHPLPTFAPPPPYKSSPYRRKTRFFWQSPGRLARPITPPRFRPKAQVDSSLHIPGSYPPSPVTSMDYLPSDPATPEVSIVREENLTQHGTLIHSIDSSQVSTVDDMIICGPDAVDDTMASDSDTMDQSGMQSTESLSPSRYMVQPLIGDQVPSIHQLHNTKDRFHAQAEVASQNHVSQAKHLHSPFGLEYIQADGFNGSILPGSPHAPSIQAATELSLVTSHQNQPADACKQQRSVASGLIESTRFPSATSQGESSLSAGTQETNAKPSVCDELIESTRSLSATSQGESSLSAGTQETNTKPSVCDESIELTRSSSHDVGQQFGADNDVVEEPATPCATVPQSRILTPALKRTKPKPAEKPSFLKFFDRIHRVKKPSSPLGLASNSANAKKNKIRKSVRFSPDPVSAMKKYVKGEAITFPSPISSRDENSILAETSGGVYHLSPTLQEQTTMINSQLTDPATNVYGHVAGTGFPDSSVVADSQAVNHQDLETSCSGSNQQEAYHNYPVQINRNSNGSLKTSSPALILQQDSQQGSTTDDPFVPGWTVSEAPEEALTDPFPIYYDPEFNPEDHKENMKILNDLPDVPQSRRMIFKKLKPGPSSQVHATPTASQDLGPQNTLSDVFGRLQTEDRGPTTPQDMLSGQFGRLQTEDRASATPQNALSDQFGRLQTEDRASSTPQNTLSDQFGRLQTEDRGPTTPQDMLSGRFEKLDVSIRRSSLRTYSKQQLAEERRREDEATAAAQKVRKDREAAQERAWKAKAEAEEKARKQAEEEEQRKKTSLRMPIEKVIQPLTSEWEQRVDFAMALAPTKVIAHTSRGTPISRRDIGRVLPQRGTGDPPSGWLNDTVIDAYLQAIVDHGNEAAGQKRGETPKFHAFNSFFYNNLREGGADKVKRWATKAKIGGKDLLKVDWVFIPVNMNENHWTLLAVSPIRRTVEYYDSFHGGNQRQIQDTINWLQSELGSEYRGDEWRIIEDPAMPGRGKGPRQTNGSDCGVHAVTTAKMISLGVDPMAYSREDVPMQRRRLVAELINGGFSGDFKPNIVFE